MSNKIIGQPSQSTQKWVKFFTHLLFLCIIFILPEILMSRNIPDISGAWRFYVKSVVLVALFYINYYIIIDYCLARKNWALKLVLINICIVLFAAGVMTLFRHDPPHRMDEHIGVMPVFTGVFRDIVMSVLTIALSVAMKLSDYWVRLSAQNKEMEAEQHREELASLKSQLNPHFLFNTLNSIYALIAISPSKAQNAVHELSRLLRYVLYENAPTVVLKDELEFVNNYIKLMKLRLNDTFPVHVELDAGDCGNCQIAPLLFISPVENAFKYGIIGAPDAEISVSIVARDGVVTCRIKNRFVAGPSSVDSGIGDANLRRRLDLIYGKRATLETVAENGIYIVELIIRL